MSKKNVTTTVDEDLWRICKSILPCSRAEFIERQLSRYVHTHDNDIEEIEAQIDNHKDMIRVLEERLAHIKAQKNELIDLDDQFDKAVAVAEKMADIRGFVTKLQLVDLADNYLVSPQGLEDKIQELGITITEVDINATVPERDSTWY